jgi:uncharacterized protein
MLTDTGPLVALVDRRQSAHVACAQVFETAELPLLTTWPCFAEAMHILGRMGGWHSQAVLWGLVRDRGLTIHAPSAAETDRMYSLMHKYQDTPMDLADASLVATAETRHLRRLHARR